MRLRAILLCVLVSLTACSRGSDPDPPASVGKYLTALQAGRFAQAYPFTDLRGQPQSSGFALTREHFEAFYRAHPLQGHEIKKVTKLAHELLQGGRRVPTSPTFVVDIELRYAEGVQLETWHVEGDIGGLIELQAAPLQIRTRQKVEMVTIDGVPTPVSPGTRGKDQVYSFSVFGGVHRVTVGATTFEILTDPLTVRSGSARVEGPFVVLDD